LRRRARVSGRLRRRVVVGFDGFVGAFAAGNPATQQRRQDTATTRFSTTV
jgi:hypothetical protein